MKYNFIETSDVIKSVYDINGTSEIELNKEYDFIVKDEVFLNFKENILKNKGLKFLIVGDYDCDGICATVIMKMLFNYLNIKSNFIIPSRINQGYGLNEDIVNMAKDNNFDCLLLVDNGVVCNKEIELARKYNIKVFIIDHHEYESLIECDDIIHPNLVSDVYSNLSAGGLSFILSKCFYDDDYSLVLGGLSTISDMMSVTGFNRFLIKTMMKILDKGDIYQLNLLNNFDQYTYESLSFNVIPKINALSRMEPLGDANKIVKYLLSEESVCKSSIEQIDFVNEKRKEDTKSMLNIATNLINNDNDVIVVSSDKFNEGLCGLVANRISSTYTKPSIILSYKDGLYKGSGRSVDGFNLYEAFKEYKNYDSFGGHEGAIGLSIEEEYYDDFVSFVSNIKIDISDYSKDALLIDESIVDINLLNEIDSLKPFGLGLKNPLVALKTKDFNKTIVSNKYLKYNIKNDFSAISFNESHKDLNPLYIIGYLRKDTYHNDSVQLLIEDLL